MSLIDQITVLILTYNEEANLRRTLQMVSWAKQILIVDSGSTDATLEIVHGFPQVRVVTRKFDDFANQCNFGLSEITSEWVLSLDADYELSSALVDEIKALVPSENVSGYKVGFIYRVYGRPLRATLYPPRTVLYRRTRAQYKNEGHGHRVSNRRASRIRYYNEFFMMTGSLFHAGSARSNGMLVMKLTTF